MFVCFRVYYSLFCFSFPPARVQCRVSVTMHTCTAPWPSGCVMDASGERAADEVDVAVRARSKIPKKGKKGKPHKKKMGKTKSKTHTHTHTHGHWEEERKRPRTRMMDRRDSVRPQQGTRPTCCSKGQTERGRFVCVCVCVCRVRSAAGTLALLHAIACLALLSPVATAMPANSSPASPSLSLSPSLFRLPGPLGASATAPLAKHP